MPRKQQNTFLTRKIALLVKAPGESHWGQAGREGTCHLLESSARVQGLYLESESQVTKKIGSAVQSEEESEASGNVCLETVLAQDSFLLVHTHVGRNRLFFFSPPSFAH